MSHYRRDNTAGSMWFFTVVTYKRQRILCDEPVRKALREAIHLTRVHWPFQVKAWVLLPDHMHCLWTLPDGDADFSIRWNLIKRRTSKALKDSYFRPEWINDSKISHRELTFWQRRFWEHRIRDERELERYIDYIHYNPVKHELCEYPADWPYSSLRRFIRNGVCPADWAVSPPEGDFSMGESE